MICWVGGMEPVDRSFLTDKVWFNSNSGEIRCQVAESLVPEGYVDNMNN